MLNNLTELNSQHNTLLTHHILVGKIAYPTVAKSQPRLRISLSAAHTQNDIENLVVNLAKGQTK
jgi:7-keto-8-aminopelargonate synthetase-like enzyme